MIDKFETIVPYLVNEELKGVYQLDKIYTPIVQGDEWIWSFLYITSNDSLKQTEEIISEIFDNIAQKMFPLSQGEILGCLNKSKLLYAPNNYLPKEISIKKLISGEASLLYIQIPDFVTNTINDCNIKENHQNRSLVYIVRVKRNNSIFDSTFLKRLIREKTWFKAKRVPYHLRKRKIQLQVGAQNEAIYPHNQEPTLQFEMDGEYYTAFQANSPMKSVKCDIYCNDGRLTSINIKSNDFLNTIHFPSANYYGFDLDIPLKFEAFWLKSSSCEDRFLYAIRNSFHIHNDLRKIMNQRLDSIKHEKTRNLEKRRTNLQKRQSVILQYGKNRKFIGLVPTNEQELIILTSKLEEVISQEIGYFKILEHTGQSGIDGFIRIKRSPDSILQEYASVEFEYELKNFLKHQHPIQQTEYIICWTIGDFQTEEIKEFGHVSLAIDRTSKNRWLKILKFYDRVIYVMPLINFPFLILEA